MQYKTLMSPSFPILMLELQEHLNAGWYINEDEKSLPCAHMMYFEVHLLLDEHREAVKEVFGEDSATLDFSKIVPKPEVKRGPKPKQ